MLSFNRAQEILRQATDAGDIPSAALAVGCKDELFVKNAWGKSISVGGDEPANVDTLYDMASLSKILGTTSVALRLIDEGRLCLADTIGDFFDAPEDKAGITIEELMTHTSGLPAHIMLKDYCKDPSEAVDCILNHPLIGPRGGQVVYSCMGFITLGRIIEKITGMKLNEAAQQYVFDPLEMKHTCYCPTSKNVAATEYRDYLGRCQRGAVHDENANFLNGISGNAGVFSNVEDCAKYATMLANFGKVGKEHFFSPAVFTQAIQNRTPAFEEGRGLGFVVKSMQQDYSGDLFPIGSIGHTGFTGTSMVVDLKTGLYTVLLTNRVHPTRENLKCTRIRHQVHNAVMAEFSKYIDR